MSHMYGCVRFMFAFVCMCLNMGLSIGRPIIDISISQIAANIENMLKRTNGILSKFYNTSTLIIFQMESKLRH